MAHSHMLAARRRNQARKKQLALTAKRTKKEGKQNAKTAGAGAAKKAAA